MASKQSLILARRWLLKEFAIEGRELEDWVKSLAKLLDLTKSNPPKRKRRV